MILPKLLKILLSSSSVISGALCSVVMSGFTVFVVTKVYEKLLLSNVISFPWNLLVKFSDTNSTTHSTNFVDWVDDILL